MSRIGRRLIVIAVYQAVLAIVGIVDLAMVAVSSTSICMSVCEAMTNTSVVRNTIFHHVIETVVAHFPGE